MGRQEPQRQLPRAGDLVGIGEPVRDRCGHGVVNACLVEVAQVAQQRHVAHDADEPLPHLRVQRPAEPARHRLPGHAGLGQAVQPVVRQHDCAALLGRDGEQGLAGPQQRQRPRCTAVPTVPATDRVGEEFPLPRRDRRGVRQFQHVTETDRRRRGVELGQRPLGVQRTDRVTDAALDRLRQGPAVSGQPVRDQLTRLVRTPQVSGNQCAFAAVLAGSKAGGDTLGGQDDRSRAQVRLVAYPADKPYQPADVVDSDRPASAASLASRSPARS